MEQPGWSRVNRSRRVTVASARHRFLSGERVVEPLVDAHIVASWDRSVRARVPSNGGDIPFRSDADPESRLAWASREPVRKAVHALGTLPVGIVVADVDGTVLARADADRPARSVLDRISLAPGFVYGEKAVGTNGVGTVIETGRSCFVDSVEHFHERFHDYACAGAPIRSPRDGSMIGVVDLTALSRDASPLMRSLAELTAAQIEAVLAGELTAAERVFYAEFSRLSARRPTFAFSADVALANAAAESLVPAAHQDGLRRMIERRLRQCDADTWICELNTGAHVLVSAHGVSHAGARVGLCATVAPAASAVTALANAPHWTKRRDADIDPVESLLPVLSTHSQSPTWRLAISGVRRALRSRRPFIVVGEPGVGKVAVISKVARTVAAASPVVVVSADADADGAATQKHPSWRAISSLYEGVLPENAVVVLKNVHEYSRGELDHVRLLLADVVLRRPDLAVVLTTRPTMLRDGGPLEPILRYTAATITIPPLRERMWDFRLIVGALMDQLDPGSASRLSASAWHRLEQFRWPGNIRQLAGVLAKAVEAAPRGVIHGEDLYVDDQVPLSGLGAVQAAERDLMVEVLRTVGGNKARAAQRLGISRSTLYRRLQMYGIGQM